MFQRNKIIIIFTVILVILSATAGAYFFVIPKLKKQEAKSPESLPQSICQKMTLIPLKNYCLAVINQDANLCQKLIEEDKLTCLAIVKNDPSYCQQLQDLESKSVCIRDLAESRGDPSVCDQINDSQATSDCYSSFVAFSFYSSNFDLLNPKLCDKILAQGPDKSMCLAMTHNDVSYCKNKECQAGLTKNAALCQEVEMSEDKDICLGDVAMTSNNPDLCEKIADETRKNNCYLDYSGHVGHDTSLCDKISSKFPREQCYKAVAEGLIWPVR